MESDKKKHLGWFISAGIVGADIGTSVFYSTGVLFPIVGYLSPLFVLITCLTMWIFKKPMKRVWLCPLEMEGLTLLF